MSEHDDQPIYVPGRGLRYPKVRRNRRLVAMRDAGATYREIANHFNITRERARQIYRREKGLPFYAETDDAEQAARADAEATLAAIVTAATESEGRRLRELFEARTGCTLGVDQNGRAYVVGFAPREEPA